MRSRIRVGAVLIVALLALTATTRGDRPSARQSAIVWLSQPTMIVSTIVQGPVLFVHDEDKMARGEPCTTVYLWEPGKGKGEEVASFHCILTHRKATSRFLVRTQPNLELGLGRILTEYQFAGDVEGHAVPLPPRMTH
jgi:hypothetical protein